MIGDFFISAFFLSAGRFLFSKPKKENISIYMKYFFIGICGISMRSLAVMLRLMGHEVAGSDRALEDLDFFEEYNIEVFSGNAPEDVEKADVVVYSSAIGEDDLDYSTAKRLGKKMLSRGELLGEISEDYEKVIAVAGAHGKTTTTALIYNVLKDKKPTLHLGGVLVEENSCFVYGGKEFFITEACEYHDNFLYLKPYIGVITNIEKEHLDYFKTFENELCSFEKFRHNCRFVVEGMGEFYAENIRHNEGRLCFDIVRDGKKVMSLKMRICEEVNVNNAIITYRTCKLLGLGDEEIKRGLENFRGVKRRFESVKSPYFKEVVVDYAHHPTEIKGAIETAKKIFKKMVFIFQPHTYSRTKELLTDFVEAFKDEKNLIIYKTFPAREKEEDGMTGEELAGVLGCKYFDDAKNLVECLKEKYVNFVPIFIGAGDLPKILEEIKFLKN